MKFELVTEDHYSNKIKRGINSQKQSNDTIKTLMSALSDMVTNI